MRCLALFGAVGATGCFFLGGDGAVARERQDAGRVCLYASPPASPWDTSQPQSFAAGAAVHVVHHEGCFSSSCTRDLVASCATAAANSAFHVTTSTSWTDLSGGDRACTDDCGFAMSTCPTPPLPAGSYTFTFAGETVALAIPSDTTEVPCLGNDGY
jgi:hypothetical protein